MIVKLTTKSGRHLRLKHVTHICKVGWTSKLSISGECRCCHKSWNKKVDAISWTVEESHYPHQEGDSEPE